MSDSSQRKFGAILSYVSIIVNSIIQLLYTPFLIKMLGQSEYGLYSLVSSIIGYLTVLDLGFGNAIVVYSTKYREQKKFEKEKKLLGMFFIIYVIIGIIASCIGIILFFNVNNLFGKTLTSLELHKMRIMMLILTFNLAITFIFGIYTSIITSHEKFIFKKIMAIVNTLLKPILMIPILFLGYKSIAMCIVITIVNIFVLLSNYLYCRKMLNIKIKFLGFDKAIFKTILGYSIFIFLGVIVDKVNWSVDNFILGMICGTTAVSIYSVAAQLNTMFLNLSTAVSGVMLPKMSKMIANNASDEELTNEMIKIGRIQFYIIFLMITGLIMFGKNFIISWVGKEYIEAYYVSLILIIPVCFPLVQNLGLSILQAKNKHKFRAIATAVMALFNVIISIFLTKLFGVIGAAVGTGISLILCNIIIINIYYYKVINLDIIKFWKEILSITLPLMIPIIFIIIFKNLIIIKGIIGLIIYICIYTILYSLSAYYLSMNNYEKNIVNKVLKKVHLMRG